MSRTIRVLFKPVDGPAREVEMEWSLEKIQEAVGGNVECVCLSERVAIWVNEEGKLIGLPKAVAWLHEGRILDVLCGNLVFTAYEPDEDGNTLGLTDEGMREAREFVQRGDLTGKVGSLFVPFVD